MTSSSGHSTLSTPNILAAEELRKMHAYWRAANYLSV
jgi:phosphoketolase